MADKPSEELVKFLEIVRRVTKSDEPVVVLVRGTILLESLLDDCLEQRLIGGTKPLKHIRMFLADKLVLARAVGIITESELHLLRAFNRLRNRVAHKVDETITAPEERDFRAAVEEHLGPKLQTIDANVDVANTDELKTIDLLRTFVLVFAVILMYRSQDCKEDPIALVTMEAEETFQEKLKMGIAGVYIMANIGDFIAPLITGIGQWLQKLSQTKITPPAPTLIPPPPPQLRKSVQSPETP